ncbi:hypothetical protein C7972_13119 [Arenibacter sp. ARW7G5Y1]|nr:hypothetical protein C7972_13119 [Arenibacter sp. ARW7G5Y1]
MKEYILFLTTSLICFNALGQEKVEIPNRHKIQ